MIAEQFNYSTADDLPQALSLIAEGAKPLAGGMSLIPMMKLRLAAPGHLVDLRGIKGLNYIEQDGDWIRIGAMTTHYQIESSPVLRFTAALLPKTACHIGDVQVRNVGTIGGSVAHADPAADYPAALFALDAKVKLASASGERTVELPDFLLDTFTTSMEPNEIITEISVAADARNTGSSYVKVVQPASGFAIVGIAVRALKSEGTVSMVRVGVTGLGPMAYRAHNVEKLLHGTAGDEVSIKKAAEVIADGVDANSDLHASADYRRHLARIHARLAPCERPWRKPREGKRKLQGRWRSGKSLPAPARSRSTRPLHAGVRCSGPDRAGRVLDEDEANACQPFRPL